MFYHGLGHVASDRGCVFVCVCVCVCVCFKLKKRGGVIFVHSIEWSL